jgi:hypothetical protein
VLSNGPVRPVNGANRVPCLVLLALGARLLPQGFELRDPFEVLILVEDAAAGRLYTMRAGEEIRHWRLSRLLPSTAIAGSPRRCCGNCSRKPRLRASPAFALRATAGKLLRIHVERFNPALRLYERLGFRPIEDKGVYLFMEWTQG